VHDEISARIVAKPKGRVHGLGDPFDFIFLGAGKTSGTDLPSLLAASRTSVASQLGSDNFRRQQSVESLIPEAVDNAAHRFPSDDILFDKRIFLKLGHSFKRCGYFRRRMHEHRFKRTARNRSHHGRLRECQKKLPSGRFDILLSETKHRMEGHPDAAKRKGFPDQNRMHASGRSNRLRPGISDTCRIKKTLYLAGSFIRSMERVHRHVRMPQRFCRSDRYAVPIPYTFEVDEDVMRTKLSRKVPEYRSPGPDGGIIARERSAAKHGN
jgi:hypothetical protein